MNIAFDAKRITNNATGLGNYSRFVLEALTEYRPENRYLLYSPSIGRPELYRELLEHRSVQLPSLVWCVRLRSISFTGSPMSSPSDCTAPSVSGRW